MPNRTEVDRMINSLNRTLAGNLTLSGANAHSGTNTFSGAVVHTGSRRLKTVTTATTLTLTAAAHGGTVVLVTAKDKSVTLPDSPAAGTVFTVVNEVASTGASVGFRVLVTGSDKVNGGTTGKGIKNTAATDAAGDSVTVISDGTDFWTINMVGTWAAQT